MADRDTNPFRSDGMIASTEDDEDTNNPFRAEGMVAQPSSEETPAASSTVPNDDYEGMSFEEADKKYNETLENENVSAPGWLRGPYATYTDPDTGESTYLRRPRPDVTSAAGDALGHLLMGRPGEAKEAWLNPEARVDNVDTFITGSAQSAGNAAELAAAGVDEVSERVTGTNPNLTESVDRLTPEVETRRLGETLVAEALPAVVSGAAAAKGTGQILTWGRESGKFIPRLLRGLGMLTAAEGAAVSTASDDAAGLVIGEEALLPITEGLDLGDEKSEQVIGQRLNLLADAFVTGGVVAGGISGTGKAAALVNDFIIQPLKTVSGRSNLEKQVYRDISKELAGLGPDPSPEALEAARSNLARTIEENKSVITASLADPSENVEVPLDSITALIRGTDNPAVAAQLESLRNGRIQNSSSFPETGAATQRSQNLFRDQLDLQATSIAGDGSAEAADNVMMRGANELAENGRFSLAAVEEPLRHHDTILSKAQDDLLAAYNSQPEFRDRFQELTELTGTDVVRGRTNLKDGITRGLQKGYEQMRGVKNQKYAAISGGDVDADMVVDMFSDLTDEQITEGMRQISRRSPIRSMMVGIQRARANAAEAAGEIEEAGGVADEAELVREEVTRFLEKNNADFGFFHNRVRPELSAIANGMYANGNPGGGSVVRGIIRQIDDDMVDYVRQSDPTLAGAAEEAKRYYSDEFAPMWRGEGRMAEYADLWEGTIGRSANNPTQGSQAAQEFDRAGYDRGAENFTQETLTTGNRYDIRDLGNALQTAGRPEDVADYMVLDVLDTFSSQLRQAGEIGSADIGPLKARLTQYSEQLNERFPKKAQQITDFVRRVENAQGSQRQIRELTDSVTSQAEAVKERILNSELQYFFRDEGMATTSNPRAAFNQLFDGKEGLAQTQDLMKRIDKLPEGNRKIVSDGLRMAYNRRLRNKIVGRKQETGGSNPVNAAAAERQLDLTQQDLKIGREIYRDQPEIMDAIESVMDVSTKQQQGRGATPVAGMSATAYNQQAQTATNRLIYMTLGPLSRAGTQARSLSQKITANPETTKRAAAFMDRMLADPEAFLAAARKYNKAPRNQEAEETLLRLMTNSSIRATNDEDAQNLPEFLQGTYDRASETARQTREAFGTMEYDR